MRAVKILLVEDNKIVLNLLKEVLESEGWSVETHEDGFSALCGLESAVQYDVIVTDNDLPGLGGLELIRHARKLPNYQHTPIIMLSANPYQTEAMHAGANEFLRKPDDVFVISRTIERLLGIGTVEM